MTLINDFNTLLPTKAEIDKIYHSKVIKNYNDDFNVNDLMNRPLFAAAFIVSPETSVFKPLVDLSPTEVIISPSLYDVEKMQRLADINAHHEMGKLVKNSMKVKNEKGVFTKKHAFSHVRQYSNYIYFFETKGEAQAFYDFMKGKELYQELERADETIKLTNLFLKEQHKS